MIGHWSQDFWCGPDYIDLKEGYNYKQIIKSLQMINKNNFDFLNTEPEISEEDFLLHSDDCLNCILNNLAILNEWEKKFKYYTRKYGKLTLGIATDGYIDYYYLYKNSSNEKVKEFIKEKDNKFSTGKKPIYMAFSSLDDFEFFEELKMEDIQIKNNNPKRIIKKDVERGR